MPIIPEFNPAAAGGGGASAPVLQDAELAAAPYRRKAEQSRAVSAFSETLIDRRLQAQDNNFLADSVTQMERRLSDAYLSAQKKRRTNPDGVSKAYHEEMQGFANDLAAQGRNTRMQDAARLKLDDLLNRYSVRMATWENNQILANWQTSLDAREQSSLEMAARSGGNLPELERLWRERAADIESATGEGGFLPPENAAVRGDRIRGQIFGIGIDAMIAGDPAGALDSLNRGEWNDWLNGIQIGAAKNKAKHALETQNRQEIARSRKRQKGALLKAEHDGIVDYMAVNEAERLEGTEVAQDFLTQLIEARQTYAAVQEVQEMPFGAMIESERQMRDTLKAVPSEQYPAALERYQKVAGAMQRVAKERADDPAGAALRQQPDLAQDYDGIMAWQASMGIPDYARSVMPKAQAQQMAAALNEAAPDELKQSFIALRDEYGEHFNTALGDLQKHGKLGMGYAMLGAMDPIADVVNQNALAQAIRSKRSDLVEVVGKDRAADITATVSDALREYHGTRLGQDADATREINQTVEKIALQHLVNGTAGSAAEAVEKAASFITGKYDFIDLNPGVFGNAEMVRIPAGKPLSEIRAGIIRETLRLQDDGVTLVHPQIAPKGERPVPGISMPYETGVEEIARDGRWVNLDDNTLVFFYGGAPVQEIVDGEARDLVRSFDALAHSSPQLDSLPELAR